MYVYARACVVNSCGLCRCGISCLAFRLSQQSAPDRNQVDSSGCDICIQEHRRRGGQKAMEWSGVRIPEDVHACVC